MITVTTPGTFRATAVALIRSAFDRTHPVSSTLSESSRADVHRPVAERLVRHECREHFRLERRGAAAVVLPWLVPLLAQVVLVGERLIGELAQPLEVEPAAAETLLHPRLDPLQAAHAVRDQHAQRHAGEHRAMATARLRPDSERCSR